MYDRNIRFETELTPNQKKALDNYIKNVMNIKEEYELVKNLPVPYIFIRIKNKPKKINTTLTPDDLYSIMLEDIVKNSKHNYSI